MLQLDELNIELFRKVLYTLWCTCGKRRVLPRPYLFQEELLKTDNVEIASGGFASVRKGELKENGSSSNSKSVCIKVIKVAEKNGEEGRGKIEKVSRAPSLPACSRGPRIPGIL